MQGRMGGTIYTENGIEIFIIKILVYFLILIVKYDSTTSIACFIKLVKFIIVIITKTGLTAESNRPVIAKK